MKPSTRRRLAALRHSRAAKYAMETGRAGDAAFYASMAVSVLTERRGPLPWDHMSPGDDDQ